MPFNRVFDEEIGRAAANACLNDGAVLDINTYCLGLTTTDAEIASVAPGIYHAFIVGMSAAATVLITGDRSLGRPEIRSDSRRTHVAVPADAGELTA